MEPVSRADVWDRLLPKTRLYSDEFARWRTCSQIYWKGTHYQHRSRVIAAFRANGAAGGTGERAGSSVAEDGTEPGP